MLDSRAFEHPILTRVPRALNARPLALTLTELLESVTDREYFPHSFIQDI